MPRATSLARFCHDSSGTVVDGAGDGEGTSRTPAIRLRDVSAVRVDFWEGEAWVGEAPAEPIERGNSLATRSSAGASPSRMNWLVAEAAESWLRGVLVSGNKGGGGARSESDRPARLVFGGMIPLLCRSVSVPLLGTSPSASTATDGSDAGCFAGTFAASTPAEFAAFAAAAAAKAIVPTLEGTVLRDGGVDGGDVGREVAG